MTAPDYLTLDDIAARAGWTKASLASFHRASAKRRREGASRPGDLPEEDKRFGRTPVWLPGTYEAWLASRPGQGTRSDLKDAPAGS